MLSQDDALRKGISFNPNGLSVTKNSFGLAAMSNGKQLEELVRLYDQVREDKEDNHIVKAVARVGLAQFSVETLDVGFLRRPLLVAESRLALSHVLIALGWLHSRGWVHRDVRWPNVLKLDADKFMLIDLEFSAKLDASGKAPWPTGVLAKEHWPVDDAEDAWTPWHDLAQVRRMFRGGRVGDGLAVDVQSDPVFVLVCAHLEDRGATAQSALAVLAKGLESSVDDVAAAVGRVRVTGAT